MSDKDDKFGEIISQFDYNLNQNSLTTELLTHIIISQSNISAMRDFLCTIIAETQHREEKDVFNEFEDLRIEYAKQILTRLTGKYGKLAEDDDKDR